LGKEFKKIDPSLCTAKQVEDALNKVDMGVAQILEDTSYLRGDNYHFPKWRGMEVIEETVSLYSDAMSGIAPQLVLFVILLYRCHDIGRLFEGCMIMTKNNAIGVPVGYANHGRAAVHLVLSRFAVSMVLGVQAQKMLDYAISRHHDRFLPDLAANASESDRNADFFARFLRDLDMLGGLLRKTDAWLGNKDKKKNEMAQYGIEDEKGGVLAAALEDFTRFLPIDAGMIKDNKEGSWETYQLCHLAWIFNINFVETLEILARERVVEKFLEYFARQFGAGSEEYRLIRDAMRRYFDRQGVGHDF